MGQRLFIIAAPQLFKCVFPMGKLRVHFSSDLTVNMRSRCANSSVCIAYYKLVIRLIAHDDIGSVKEINLDESIAAAPLLVLGYSSLNKQLLLFQWVFFPQAFQNRCLLGNGRPIGLALD